jgi:tRNA threonylcarbamoyl adenosine modification protein YeaZ
MLNKHTPPRYRPLSKGGKLEGVIVCLGPGSFTGIRIGLSVANAFAWSLNIPIVGVSSLEALAQHALNHFELSTNAPAKTSPPQTKRRNKITPHPDKLISLINAGRDEVYIAIYEHIDQLTQNQHTDLVRNWRLVRPFSIHPLDQLYKLCSRSTLVTGILPSKYRDSIKPISQQSMMAVSFDEEPSLASALARIGTTKLGRKKTFKSTGQVSPLYIREAHITQSKKPTFFHPFEHSIHKEDTPC